MTIKRTAEALFNNGFNLLRDIGKNPGALTVSTMKDTVEKAYDYFRQASVQNHPEAIFQMGQRYYKGFLIKMDKNRAFQYYRNAAQLNYAPAQFMVAYMLDKAVGIEEDKKEAYIWYERAAKNNELNAQFILALHYDNHNNNEKAIYWYKQAINQGHIEAKNNLAILYLKLEPKNINACEKAIKLLEDIDQKNLLRNEQNLKIAWMHLANLYYQHENYQEAYNLYEKASKKFNNDTAFFILGRMNLGDKNINKNYNNVEKFWKKIADDKKNENKTEVANAQYALGCIYDKKQDMHGICNTNLALKYYNKAAKNGNAAAQYNLGMMYQEGHGCNIDKNEAQRWFKKAKENGYKKDLTSNLEKDFTHALMYLQNGHFENAKNILIILEKEGYKPASWQLRKIKIKENFIL